MIHVDLKPETKEFSTSQAVIDDMGATKIREIWCEFIPWQTPASQEGRYTIHGYGRNDMKLYIGLTSDLDDKYTHTITVPSSLPSTIYGCKVYLSSEHDSVFVLTWGYISNYMGGNLPGRWVSDRDIYVPGTLPSIGAAVAYELSSGTTVQIPQFSLVFRSLTESNTIWHNGVGTIDTVKYYLSEELTRLAFINALADGSRQHVKVKFPSSKYRIEFNESQIESSGISISTQMNEGNVFRFGSAYSTQVTIPLIDYHSTQPE